MAGGHLYFNKKNQTILRILCQISFVLPSIFTLLICMNILNPFPYGHIGVVFIFMVTHLGFATIYIADALQSKLSNLGLIAKIYNIKRLHFHLKIVLPLIKRDLLTLGLIIFLSCLASFSIPLIAGGGKGTNLEVYIYEKIFIDQKWTEAIWLTFIQAAVLFVVAHFAFNFKKVHFKIDSDFSHIYLSSKLAAVFLLTYIFAFVCSYMVKVYSVLIDSDIISIFDSEFFNGFANSLVIFLCSGIVIGLVLTLIIYLLYRNKKVHLTNIFLSPSTVLVGFILYIILPSYGNLLDYFKVSIGLLFIFSVGLYRLHLSAKLESLKSQMQLCQIYRIDFRTFLTDIFWPQAKNNIIFLISLIYLISVSEFALIKTSGVQIQTLGTLTELYLNSYRMNQAYIISFFNICSWALLYLVLRGICVFDRKS